MAIELFQQEPHSDFAAQTHRRLQNLELTCESLVVMLKRLSNSNPTVAQVITGEVQKLERKLKELDGEV